MRFSRARAVLLAMSLSMASAIANTGETPATLDGAKTVSASQAKSLAEAGASIFDVRRKAAYLEGRVPKAKSIQKSGSGFDAAVFGGNKDAQLVIYGHGSDGWSAVDAVKAAVAAGFKHVHWLRGGWKEWSGAGLPSEE